jgi:hypothetical protein
MPTSLAELLHHSSRRDLRAVPSRLCDATTTLIWMTDEQEIFENDNEVDEIEQLRATPVEIILGNYVFHLIQLAAVHLAATPAQLPQAQLTIDVVAAMLKAGDERLGENVALYRNALAEVQQLYVRAASNAP